MHGGRKLDQRLDLMRGATAKCGGVYLYANQRGCDGGRLYYDGSAVVYMNGHLLAQVPSLPLLTDDSEHAHPLLHHVLDTAVNLNASPAAGSAARGRLGMVSSAAVRKLGPWGAGQAVCGGGGGGGGGHRGSG